MMRLAFTLLRRNFAAYVSNYRGNRGMDFIHDVHDWLGGYPYKSIRPADAAQQLTALGFAEVRITCVLLQSAFSAPAVTNMSIAASGLEELMPVQPLRISVVTSRLDIGGTERHLTRVLPALKRRGIDVTLYVMERGGPLEAEIAAQGVRVEGPARASFLHWPRATLALGALASPRAADRGAFLPAAALCVRLAGGGACRPPATDHEPALADRLSRQISAARRRWSGFCTGGRSA